MGDELEPTVEKESTFAFQDTDSPFDVTIPQTKTPIKANSNRITYTTKKGIIYNISLAEENNNSQPLFLALSAGFRSEWFDELSEATKPTYILEARKFINWLNRANQKYIESNRYELFKSYEAYTINEKGYKESGLRCITKIVREGISSPELSNDDTRYLQILLRNSKPIKAHNKTSFTLTEWFALPWLRPILGEDIYLQLESPQRLLLSFRVTIATTLQFLLEFRAQWQKSHQKRFDPSYKGWQYDWNRILLKNLGCFNSDGLPADEFTEFLCLDLVKPRHQTYLKSAFSSSSSQLHKKYKINRKIYFPWQKPVFFHPEYYHQYSPVEETLCAWLIACEAIQPLDIQKLKTTDYAVEISAYGRLIAIECSYYKGRSGSRKQPATLAAKDSWTRALFLYIQGLHKSSPLFRSRVHQSQYMPGLGKHSTRHTTVNLLMNMWKSPDLQNRIHAELRRAGASPLFLKAMSAIERFSEPQDHLRDRHKLYSDKDRPLAPNSLPTYIFSLTHIKNTAVHAGTDKYRDCDLINHHSHTSHTEKHAYLTDENKDFVNRLGRVTRMILHDLQNIVYQPSISAIHQAAYEKTLHTRVIEMTGALEVNIHPLNQAIDKVDLIDDIVVLDSTESALVFIHYIQEAERMLPRLLEVRPDWVERTLIVQIEWMTRTLSRMKFAKKAQSHYTSLQPYLPPLFSHILETVE